MYVCMYVCVCGYAYKLWAHKLWQTLANSFLMCYDHDPNFIETCLKHRMFGSNLTCLAAVSLSLPPGLPPFPSRPSGPSGPCHGSPRVLGFPGRLHDSLLQFMTSWRWHRMCFGLPQDGGPKVPGTGGCQRIKHEVPLGKMPTSRPPGGKISARYSSQEPTSSCGYLFKCIVVRNILKPH